MILGGGGGGGGGGWKGSSRKRRRRGGIGWLEAGRDPETATPPLGKGNAATAVAAPGRLTYLQVSPLRPGAEDGGIGAMFNRGSRRRRSTRAVSPRQREKGWVGNRSEAISSRRQPRPIRSWGVGEGREGKGGRPEDETRNGTRRCNGWAGRRGGGAGPSGV